MSTGPIPAMERHTARASTRRAATRTIQRLASNLNAPTKSDILAGSAHGCSVYNGSCTTTDATDNPIAWGAATYDTDGWFTASSSHITVTATGLYLVTASLYVAAPGGGIVYMRALKNVGATKLLEASYISNLTTGQVLLSGVVSLTAGDYIVLAYNPVAGTSTVTGIVAQVTLL